MMAAMAAVGVEPNTQKVDDRFKVHFFSEY